MQANDEAVNSQVLSVNRGGLLVEVEHLRGFVPQSHIAIRTPNREAGGVKCGRHVYSRVVCICSHATRITEVVLN